MIRSIVAAALTASILSASHAEAQPLDMTKLGAPAIDTWPTYNGDYSGRRFSTLKQINTSNVKSLQLQWSYQIQNLGAQRGTNGATIKATPLVVNDVVYFTIPNHVYAVDARTGAELWTYKWVDQGGHLIGNRGLGMYKDMLYFLGPDCWIIALDAGTGKERWRRQIADARTQYYTNTAPMIVKNHLLVGVGGDAMDLQGFLLSLDPETGDIQWRWDTTPKAGEPGIETWPDAATAARGGGMTWLSGTYDESLNLIFWGTGNVNPVYNGAGRPGSNLFTGSIVALDVDTGKLKWWFQTAPRDTHDWDNVETPVMIDTVIDGTPRKLIAQAARNGYFVVVDRTNGRNVLTEPFVPLNWSKGLNERGEPIPDPDKEPKVAGSITISSATNWPPPSYSPKTGLFYLNGSEGWTIYYVTDVDPRPAGYAGTTASVGASQRFLGAIDVKTGKYAWRHDYPVGGTGGGGGGGVLSTAGGLVFTGDGDQNLIAFRDTDGEILYHTRMAEGLSNGPVTVMQDGRQMLLVGAGDTLSAYALPQK